MNENEFWINFWKMICTTVCVLSTVIASCNNAIEYQDNAAIVEIVAKGSDPQDALCAIKGEQRVINCAAATRGMK